jgi:hypothetical protein
MTVWFKPQEVSVADRKPLISSWHFSLSETTTLSRTPLPVRRTNSVRHLSAIPEPRVFPSAQFLDQALNFRRWIEIDHATQDLIASWTGTSAAHCHLKLLAWSFLKHKINFEVAHVLPPGKLNLGQEKGLPIYLKKPLFAPNLPWALGT